MSLPLGPKSPQIRIQITAASATRLAHEIDWVLSRVQDRQETEPTCMLDSKANEIRWLKAHLETITVCKGVTISIVSDQRTPTTSGYFNYSAPMRYVKDTRIE